MFILQGKIESAELKDRRVDDQSVLESCHAGLPAQRDRLEGYLDGPESSLGCCKQEKEKSQWETEVSSQQKQAKNQSPQHSKTGNNPLYFRGHVLPRPWGPPVPAR